MSLQTVEFDWVAAAPLPARRLGSEAERAVRPVLRVVGEAERAPRTRLRLTARGRLLRTLLVFGLLCLMGLLAWARVTAPVLPPTHEITVLSGQSLTHVAAEELPMLPLEEAMLRIRQANGLNSSVVMAGQRLIVPGRD